MKEVVYVNSGEVKFGGKDIFLNSGAIGSCVVVTFYNQRKKTGAMAHIMLPGKLNSKSNGISNKYAENAINFLIKNFCKEDNPEDFIATMVGAGNVLRKENDSLCENIIQSVESELLKSKINIVRKNVGGFERRTVQFDAYNGNIDFSLGDSNLRELFYPKNKIGYEER